MDTVRVAVWRAGQSVDTIDEPPLDQSATEAVTSSSRIHGLSQEQMAEQPHDAGTRREIIGAPASARMIVEAGPGMGKTEVAARRLASLIRNELSPAQILV